VTRCSLADGCQGFGGICCYTFSLSWRWRQRFLRKISNYVASRTIKLQFPYLSPWERHISGAINISRYMYEWQMHTHILLYCSILLHSSNYDHYFTLIKFKSFFLSF
jgi:hypothetical protein